MVSTLKVPYLNKIVLIVMKVEHKWDILSYRGKLYYRETLYNGLNMVNPNYNVILIRRYEV